MVSIEMMSLLEMQKKIASHVRTKRLDFNYSQKTLSEKSGVSYGVLKKFEQTGQISLESLLQLALALEATDDFKEIFTKLRPKTIMSLDDLIKEGKGTRKRGRE